MRWRPFLESDLSRCLQMQPACLGDQVVGRESALDIWRQLIQEPGFLATVIEEPLHGNVHARGDYALQEKQHQMVGCGMGVFVRADFVDSELAHPGPGMNSRLIARIADGERILLSREEIGKGNATGGLDFVNLYGTWCEQWSAGDVTPDRIAEVQILLGTGFAQQFSGYRFKRVLKEAIGKGRIHMARATGSYRIVAAYPETDSALAVVDRESALASPYSVAASLYRYQSPVLRLRPAEQELLTAALSGKTDAELSRELGLSLEATKKRWLSVFDRIGQYNPEILSGNETEGEGRGPQKRHRIVAYVRSHPQELRPYAWPGSS